jgi:hypothetical protein
MWRMKRPVPAIISLNSARAGTGALTRRYDYFCESAINRDCNSERVRR